MKFRIVTGTHESGKYQGINKAVDILEILWEQRNVTVRQRTREKVGWVPLVGKTLLKERRELFTEENINTMRVVRHEP